MDVCTSQTKHRLIVVYRPPSNEPTGKLYAATLISILSSLSLVTWPVFIVGDFNCPCISWDHFKAPVDNKLDLLLDFSLFNGFSQLVNEPTRQDNIFDLVLCNEPLLITGVDIQSPVGKSDHASVKFHISLGCSSYYEPDCNTDCNLCRIYRWKDTDYDSSLILEVCHRSRELSVMLMWIYLHDTAVLCGFIICTVNLFICSLCIFVVIFIHVLLLWCVSGLWPFITNKYIIKISFFFFKFCLPYDPQKPHITCIILYSKESIIVQFKSIPKALRVSFADRWRSSRNPPTKCASNLHHQTNYISLYNKYTNNKHHWKMTL